MALAEAKVHPRLKEQYDREIRPALVQRFGYTTPMQAPKLQKIIYYFISDGNTAFAKYRTGDLDMLNVPIANVDVVRQDAQP